MKSAKGKLTGLMVFAALSAFNPCFADSIYDGADEQLEVPTYAWADRQAAPAPAACQAQMPRTSRRTNTNLSKSLPPTVTCSMKLSVLDDRDYTPVAAEPQIEINIIRENAAPVNAHRYGMRGPRYSEGF